MEHVSRLEAERGRRLLPDEAEKFRLVRVFHKLLSAVHGQPSLVALRVAAAVAAARVITGAVAGEDPARVLPELAAAVPVKTKVRKNGGNSAGLLTVELHPDPLPDNLGKVMETGRFLTQQVQEAAGVQLAVGFPTLEVDPVCCASARMFGTALEL